MHLKGGWFIINIWSNLSLAVFLVGSGDNSPLSKDTISSCWYPSWLTRWRGNNREACQEQAETNSCWGSREVSTWAESCQICWMLCINTERLEECIWWGNLGSARTPRATKEKEVYTSLNNDRVTWWKKTDTYISSLNSNQTRFWLPTHVRKTCLGLCGLTLLWKELCG